MDENCSIKPRNLREFLKSTWFKKPFLVLTIGSIIGMILYNFLDNSRFTNNIYGDLLSGMIIVLFFTGVPCIKCRINKEI
jgi:hypothetical protein